MVDLKNNKVFKVIKNIWFAVASVLAVAFIVIMGVSCSRVNKTNNNNVNTDVSINEVVKSRVNPKMVSYDDSELTITLTASETRFCYENFYNLFYEYNTHGLVWESVSFSLNINGVLNNYIYDSSSSDENVVYFGPNGGSDDSYVVGLVLDWEGLGFPEDYYPHYNYYFYNASVDTLLDVPLIINSDAYALTKSAIEQDIRINEDVQIYDNNGIFDTISSSMVAFIGSLSSGITAMVGVFYNNGALTVIGLLSVIVLAISLAYFLFRLFIGLIRMRG